MSLEQIKQRLPDSAVEAVVKRFGLSSLPDIVKMIECPMKSGKAVMVYLGNSGPTKHELVTF